MGDRGHNRHAPKRGGGAVVSLSWRAGTPSNTMWPAPRSTSVPSGILIHPAVWLKIGERESAPFLGRGAGSPRNTMSSGRRPVDGVPGHPRSAVE